MVEAKELWERPWIEVESPNFRVLSEVGEEKTRALVEDLEYFRRAVELLTNIERFEARIPTKVFLFSRRHLQLGLGRNLDAYFLPGMRANYAVVSASERDRNYALKHEYVHFLLRNQGDQIYPPWFDEGFADYLSTLTAEQGTITFGAAPPSLAYWLGWGRQDWLSFRRLLTVRDVLALNASASLDFYAQSWLLVHYLNATTDPRTLSARQQTYFELSEAGVSPPMAFERAFGLEIRRLQAVLEAYVDKARARVLRPKEAWAPPTLHARAVAPADIATELAELTLLNGGNEKTATAYVDAALALRPDHCDALVWRADLMKWAGRWQEAQPFYERAIALDPESAEHELDYAEFYFNWAEEETDAARRQALLVDARRHFARSHALDPSIPETLAMNGRSYLFPGEDVKKGVASLEAAHHLLPSHYEIRLYLALAYLAASETALARKHLEALITWSRNEKAEEVRSLLQSLDPPAKIDAGGEAGSGAELNASQ